MHCIRFPIRQINRINSTCGSDSAVRFIPAISEAHACTCTHTCSPRVYTYQQQWRETIARHEKQLTRLQVGSIRVSRSSEERATSAIHLGLHKNRNNDNNDNNAKRPVRRDIRKMSVASIDRRPALSASNEFRFETISLLLYTPFSSGSFMVCGLRELRGWQAIRTTIKGEERTRVTSSINVNRLIFARRRACKIAKQRYSV